MKLMEIRPGICQVGAVDWDRRLFDALIPLPDGTSYNSYLIKGSEKTALIDTVDPTMQDILINNLNQLGIDNIDYVIANHAEQDHSGAIPLVLEKYPSAKVIATPRCKDILIDLLMIPEQMGISLGKQQIVYVPTHRQEDYLRDPDIAVKEHDDILRGFITSMNKGGVFCRYFHPPSISDELRTKGNSERASFDNIYPYEHSHKDRIERAWKQWVANWIVYNE